MAFTVGTNSFVSVADADAYFLDRGNATWSAATTTEKEQALVRGTDYLVEKYVDCWAGSITSTSQALPWPRTGVVTSDGVIIDSGTIPAAIENATAEMGLRGLSTSDLFADVGAGDEFLKRNKVDVLEKEWDTTQGGKTTQSVYTKVEKMLTDYVICTGNYLKATRGYYDDPYGYWGCKTLRS